MINTLYFYYKNIITFLKLSTLHQSSTYYHLFQNHIQLLNNSHFLIRLFKFIYIFYYFSILLFFQMYNQNPYNNNPPPYVNNPPMYAQSNPGMAPSNNGNHI
jgi:hypothetical protein